MNLTKKRWLVLAVSCLINLCIGSMYAWSVFASPMAEHLSAITGRSLSAGDLALVFSVANAVGPVTMISGGYINDRFGPKFVIFAGGLLFGGGMFLSGFCKSVAALLVCYGLMTGLGLGFTYGCTINNSVKFFPDRRGLIGGLTTAAYGISSVLVPPLANAINSSMGISASFKIFGAVFGLIICVGALFIEKCPSDFTPDGWIPPTSATEPQNDRNWREMLSMPVFYIMLLLLLSGAVSGMMCISQAASLAQNQTGLSSSAAAVAVSLLALFNTAGRISAGSLSDKAGRINTLTLALLASLIGLVLLCFAGQGKSALLYAGFAVVGMAFGSFMGVFPGFTADEFGVKNNSVNYGILFIGFALAGILGPNIMSRFYTAQGNYRGAFLAAIVIAAAGLVLTAVYRALKHTRA